MQQLEKAGLSLVQIFKAATIGNAREFKLASQLGTIEPGMVADLVLLRKSPLKSLDRLGQHHDRLGAQRDRLAAQENEVPGADDAESFSSAGHSLAPGTLGAISIF
jgi:cytosine/adenosine deaminase-related metal-dependent hydrolase